VKLGKIEVPRPQRSIKKDKNHPKVGRTRNKRITQIIKSDNSRPDPHGLPGETGVIGWAKNSIIKSDPTGAGVIWDPDQRGV